MADSEEALLKLIDQATGENPTTWGTKQDTVNALLAQAAKNAYAYVCSAATGDLTLSDDAYIANENRRALIRITGTRSAAGNIIFPTRALVWDVVNETAYAMTCKTSAGTGVQIPVGEYRRIYCDGTDIVDSELINQTQLTAQLSANSAAGFSTTSTTSNAISVAGTNLTFTTADSGKAFSAGSPLRIAYTSDPANFYMDAIVTSYSGTTLDVTVTDAVGSGTLADWAISVAGGPDVTQATLVRVAKTANYAVDLSDNGNLIDCTSGSFTVSLPAAATAGAGFNVRFINTGSGGITIDPNGSETINGDLSYTLLRYQFVHLLSTGTGWIILADSRRRIRRGMGASTYTVSGVDIGAELNVTAASTVTLGASSIVGAGFTVDIANETASDVVIVQRDGSDLIKDNYSLANTATYLHPGQAMGLIADGVSTWHVLRDTRPPVETWAVALSDETTAITTGTAKVSLRFPYGFEMVSTPVSSVGTASSSGLVTIDINDDGSTIFGSNKLSIDANETTSTTAATAATFTAPARIASGSVVTFDIDAAGTGAKGLKAYMVGRRTP